MDHQQNNSEQPKTRIPLWLKLGYTAFMAVLIPIYWHNYGPTNFLYFCDIALIVALIAIWRENALLASIPTVGILLPQLAWCLDFACGIAGWFPLGLTRYMFDEALPLHLRALSLFHGWLPFLLLYLVIRLGYDRRALWLWTLTAWLAMAIAFFTLPKAANPDEPSSPYNVNYVFGVDGPQTWMSEWAWFALVMLAVPLVFAVPAHMLLRVQQKVPPA